MARSLDRVARAHEVRLELLSLLEAGAEHGIKRERGEREALDAHPPGRKAIGVSRRERRVEAVRVGVSEDEERVRHGGRI